MLLHILISKGEAFFFRPPFLMGLYRGGLRPHLMRDLIIALYINKAVVTLGNYILNVFSIVECSFHPFRRATSAGIIAPEPLQYS